MRLWRPHEAETQQVKVVVEAARDETNVVLRQMADLVIKLDASTERLERAVERLIARDHDERGTVDDDAG